MYKTRTSILSSTHNTARMAETSTQVHTPVYGPNLFHFLSLSLSLPFSRNFLLGRLSIFGERLDPPQSQAPKSSAPHAYFDQSAAARRKRTSFSCAYPVRSSSRCAPRPHPFQSRCAPTRSLTRLSCIPGCFASTCAVLFVSIPLARHYGPFVVQRAAARQPYKKAKNDDDDEPKTERNW